MSKQDKLFNKSIIKANILQFIELQGITKYNFYKKTGITRGILDQNNGISEENTARFLAHFPEVSADWLLSGKGQMKKRSYEKLDEKISPILEEVEVAFKKEFPDDNLPPGSCPNCTYLNHALKLTERALEHAEKALLRAEGEINSQKKTIYLLEDRIRELNIKINEYDKSK